MTRADELEALAKRCEAASGADRELDALIHLALFPDFGAKHDSSWVRFEDVWKRNRAEHINHANNVADWWHVPRVTSSLDAAMTLVLTEGEVITSSVRGEHTAQVAGPDGVFEHCGGKTVALALCAASLRSRARMTEGK